MPIAMFMSMLYERLGSLVDASASLRAYCRNKSPTSLLDCTSSEEGSQWVVSYAYRFQTQLLIPSLQISSSRGRAELSNMGYTINPTLAVYSRGVSALPMDCVCHHLPL